MSEENEMVGRADHWERFVAGKDGWRLSNEIATMTDNLKQNPFIGITTQN